MPVATPCAIWLPLRQNAVRWRSIAPTAGTLFNILSTLRTQGKQIKLQNVNAMVAALLRVMGVDQVAQVMVRA